MKWRAAILAPLLPLVLGAWDGDVWLAAGESPAPVVPPPVGVPLPLVVVDGLPFDDGADGNANGAIDPSETIQQRLVLWNRGNATASNLTARLTCQDPNVTVLRATALFPNLLPGTRATNAEPFTYRLAKLTPCGSRPRLALIVQGDLVSLTNSYAPIVGRRVLAESRTNVYQHIGEPQPIPDGGELFASLDVDASGVIDSMSVSVRIDHTRVGDLELALRHPDGTEILLRQANDDRGPDFGQGACDQADTMAVFDDSAESSISAARAPFTGVFRPEQPLATFHVRALAGAWQLRVADRFFEGHGALQCWGVRFVYWPDQYVCDPYNNTPAAENLAVDAGFETPQRIQLAGTDVDQDPLGFELEGPPAHGFLSAFGSQTGTVTYTPEADFTGQDAFTFNVFDGTTHSPAATVRVSVGEPVADLAITQYAEAGPLAVGRAFTWSVVATNQGPNRAEEVVVEDQLPVSMELVDANVTQGSVTVAAGSVRAALGRLPSGAQARLDLLLKPKGPGWHTNSAEIVSRDFDPAPANNGHAFVVQTWGRAGVQVRQAVDPNPPLVSQPMICALAVTNTGPKAALDVVLHGELPAEWQVEQVEVSQGTYQQHAGSLDLHLGLLEAGETVSVRLHVIPRSVGLGTNVVRLEVTDAEFTVSNRVEFPVEVAPIANLAVLPKGLLRPVLVGDNFAMVWTVANQGPNDATGVRLTVTLSEPVQVVSASMPQGRWTTDPTGAWIGELGSLRAGQEVELTLVLKTEQPGSVVTRARLRGREADLVEEDNQLTRVREVRGRAELRLSRRAPESVVVGWGWNEDGQALPPNGLEDVKAVAAGYAHSLALRRDGTVVAWGGAGRRDYGQGRVPDGLTNVVAIAAGYFQNLALHPDGTIDVWGRDDYGQGTLPSGATNLTGIAAGGYHNLAIRVDGTVLAWGANEAGQCAVPPGLDTVIAVAAGGRHSLALREDGTVVAWGGNEYGQSSVPPDLTGVVALAAGERHSLALRADGTLLAWGMGSVGQASVPVSADDLTAVAAGVYHSLALRRDGTLLGWGWDADGQADVPVSLTRVLGLAAGYRHSLALVGSDWWVEHHTNRVFVGEQLRLEFEVANDGPLAAHQATLRVTLPAGLELVDATMPGGALRAEGRDVVLELGDLQAQAKVPVRVVLRATAAGGSTAVAILSAPEFDLDPANNRWEEPVWVEEAGDLELVQSMANAPVAAGETVKLKLTVTNRGPQEAHKVIVRETLPDSKLGFVDLDWLLTPRTNQVSVSPYEATAVAGSPSWGPGWGSTRFEWVAIGNRFRVRQDGTVTQARFYTPNLANVTGVYLRLWREAATGYDLVGESENLLNQLTPGGMSTVSVSIPGVRQGDYTGMLTTYTASAGFTYSAQHWLAGTGYFTMDQVASTRGFEWEQQSALRSAFPVVELYMRAPVFVALGDSIMAGAPWNLTFLHLTNHTDVASTIPEQLSRALSGASYQNMAIGGQSTVQMITRFNNDVLALKPKFALLQGGIMNIALDKALDFQPDVTQMVSACQANDIVPVFVDVLPYTVQKFSPDFWLAITYWHSLSEDWNAWLAKLLPEHGGLTIPSRQILGVAYVGGPPGNRWNLQTEVDWADGIHLNRYGIETFAAATAAELRRAFSNPASPQVVAIRASQGLGEVRADGQIVVALGTLAPDASADIEIELKPRVAGRLNLTASATASQRELAGGDNTAPASLVVAPGADLSLQSQTTSRRVMMGAAFEGRWTVKNLGPQAASQAQVQVELPASWRMVSARSSQGTWTTSASGSRVCRLGALPVGAEAELVLTLEATALGTVRPLLQVSATETDFELANNRLDEPWEVRGAADLRLSGLRPIGGVAAWGANEAGQSRPPARLRNLRSVAAGWGRSLALQADGTAVMWGGSGAEAVPPGLSNVVAVAAGDQHSLALLADGRVVAWGANDSGQASPPEGLSNVVAVAGGGAHSLALRGNGTVAAWGANGLGQTDVPLNLAEVVAVAAGWAHSLALRADGTVVAWGSTEYGQSDVPEGLNGVIAVAAGGYHSLALRRDGTVVSWGWNDFAQATVPTGLSNVVAISAGRYHSLALRADGTAVAWGWNQEGQAAVPSGLAGVRCIAAGARHNLAVTDRTEIGQPETQHVWLNEPFGLEFQVVNSGPQPAAKVVLREELSDGVELLAGQTSQGTLQIRGRVVMIEVDELLPGEAALVALTCRATSVGPMTNVAVVASDEFDPHPEDNCLRAPVSVEGGVDLGLRLEVAPPAVHVDETLQLLWHARNEGPLEATQVSLQVRLPDSLELRSITGVERVATNGAGVLECALGTLRAGEDRAVEIAARARRAGTVRVFGHLTAEQPDLAPGDNTTDGAVPILPSAILNLQLRSDPGPVAVDGVFESRWRVTNDGPASAHEVVLFPEITGPLVVASLDTSQGRWRTNDAGQITCELGTVPPGEHAEVVLRFQPTGLGYLITQMAVRAFEPDFALDNNSAIETVEVRNRAELQLTLLGAGPLGARDGGAPTEAETDLDAGTRRAVLGETWLWEFQVLNSGPATAQNVVFLDHPSTGLHILGAEASQGQPYLDGDALVCPVGSLAPGSSATLQVTTRASAVGVLTNFAQAHGDEVDPNPDDNQVLVRVAAAPVVDLTLEQQVSSSTVFSGDQVTFTVSLANQGPHTANGVVVQQRLGAGGEAIMFRTSQGSGRTQGAGEVTWEPGSLAAGQLARMELDVIARRPGDLICSGQASALEFEMAPDNNVATTRVTVLPRADLSAGIPEAETTAFLGGSLRFRAEVTNHGPDVAANVRADFELGEGLLLDHAELSRGLLVTNATGGLVWDVGDLEAFASAQARVSLVPRLPGLKRARLTLHSDTDDPSAADRVVWFEALVADQPQLHAYRTEGRLMLEWAALPNTYVLETAADLLPLVWSRDTTPQVATGHRITVSVELSAQSRFYRLRRE